MRKRLITLSAGFLLVAACSSHANGVSVEPGMWETVSKATMQGPAMPGVPPTQTVKYTHCVTSKESHYVPMDEDPHDKCALHKQVHGDRISWTASCVQDGGKATNKGEATYSGSKIIGHFVMTVPGMSPGHPMVMKGDFTSRRVGSCKS